MNDKANAHINRVADHLFEQERRVPMARVPFDPDAQYLPDGTLPGNSYKERSKTEGPKPVVTGTVVRKKKGLFTGTLIAEDLGNVTNYIFWEVLIPAAKSTLSDIITSGIDRMLYGGENPTRTRSSSQGYSGSVISYGRYYNKPTANSRSRPEPTRAHENAPRRMDIHDIRFETRNDATAVLDALQYQIDQYGVATVADLYDLIGRSSDSSYVDNNYGWDRLGQVSISNTREGFAIALPRAIPLK